MMKLWLVLGLNHIVWKRKFSNGLTGLKYVNLLGKIHNGNCQCVTMRSRTHEIDGTPGLLIIPFFATLPNLIQHSSLINFGEFCQCLLLFQTPHLLIYVHSWQWLKTCYALCWALQNTIMLSVFLGSMNFSILWFFLFSIGNYFPSD